jgi:hypothetical protein
MGVAELIETQDTTDRPPFKVADLSLAEFGRKRFASPSRKCPA